MSMLPYRLTDLVDDVCDIGTVVALVFSIATMIGVLVLAGAMAISGESIVADCCCKAVMP